MSDTGVEFSHFVISLAQGVMVGLGEVPDPETRQTQLNLPMASHSLAVLQCSKKKPEAISLMMSKNSWMHC